MKILFDQGVPIPLRKELPEYQIHTAYEKGWSILKNGQLIEMAEKENYNLLISTDQNLKYQQNLSQRKISLLILSTTNWNLIKTKIALIKEAIVKVQSRDYVELKI